MTTVLLSCPEQLAETLLSLYPDISVVKPASKVAPPEKSYLPYADEESPIWTTPRKAEALTRDLGFACVEYLSQQLIRYAEDQPRKFAKYKDHAAVLRRWHEMKIGDGYVFSEKHGQYVKRWVAREDGVL